MTTYITFFKHFNQDLEATTVPTKAAFVKVTNDLLMASDKGLLSVLLLDLSAAFDTIDHAILLWLESLVNIKGTTLEWFESYLKNRNLSVFMTNPPNAFMCPPSLGIGPNYLLSIHVSACYDRHMNIF